MQTTKITAATLINLSDLSRAAYQRAPLASDLDLSKEILTVCDALSPAHVNWVNAMRDIASDLSARYYARNSHTPLHLDPTSETYQCA